jgi:hypothetical protein
VQIQFAPTEYVKKFSGSIVRTNRTWVVTYLEIETNLETYKISDSGSPFGVSLPGAGKGSPIGIILPEAQTPFSIPVPQGTSIVGFFGRAEDSLDAIGVYVKSSRFLQSDDDAAEDTSGSQGIYPLLSDVDVRDLHILIFISHLVVLACIVYEIRSIRLWIYLFLCSFCI